MGKEDVEGEGVGGEVYATLGRGSGRSDLRFSRWFWFKPLQRGNPQFFPSMGRTPRVDWLAAPKGSRVARFKPAVLEVGLEDEAEGARGPLTVGLCREYGALVCRDVEMSRSSRNEEESNR